MSLSPSPPQVAEHLFRHEYGQLVATLVRRFGVAHLELAEDAAQSALMAALETWTRAGVPDAPSAWLYRVAHNRLTDDLRQRANRARILAEDNTSLSEPTPTDPAASEVNDDLLRMLFACCDEALPPQSQLVLALKVLLGFDSREIAARLFTSEANVYKRLKRARDRLRAQAPHLPELSRAQVASRLPGVHRVLYVLFTEGHLSSHATLSIRRELCQEAIRLATILATHPLGQTPETFALLALMTLHLARLPARQDASGGLLLLDEQERDLWDRELIQAGMQWLARSADGDTYSRYHAEASIASEHCLAPTFGQTRWDRVAETYALLNRIAPSPLHTLNHAVALAEAHGPEAGLALLDRVEPPTWLDGSHMWAAVVSDLNRRCGNVHKAHQYREAALQSAPTDAVRTLLKRRLASSS
ncbi:MAG: sigma-70 family RNA polymerase sigma factor [Rubricoccaceae bacterium]